MSENRTFTAEQRLWQSLLLVLLTSATHHPKGIYDVIDDTSSQMMVIIMKKYGHYSLNYGHYSLNFSHNFISCSQHACLTRTIILYKVVCFISRLFTSITHEFRTPLADWHLSHTNTATKIFGEHVGKSFLLVIFALETDA